MKIVQTLVMFRDGDRLLLGLKKQGFGEGRWNGFGGKLDAGETIEECARREVREEIGVEVEVMEKFGLMQFEFTGKPETIEVHAFDVKKYSGEPKEIEKLIPQWFAIEDVPFADMWPDDPFWYPLYLYGNKFKGRFLFDEKGDKVLKVNLEMVEKV